MTVGYSGTPLAKKLSLKPGLVAWSHGMPASVRAEIGEAGLNERREPVAGLDAAHVFTCDRAELERLLASLRGLLSPNGFVWVSWPKRTSKVPTDITEETIRDVCLPMGFVDIKVCAIDQTWSGLKLVIRRELR